MDFFQNANPHELPVSEVVCPLSSSPVEFQSVYFDKESKPGGYLEVCARPASSSCWRRLLIVLMFIYSFSLFTTLVQASGLSPRDAQLDWMDQNNRKMMDCSSSSQRQVRRSTLDYLNQNKLLHLYTTINHSKRYIAISDEGNLSLSSQMPPDNGKCLDLYLIVLLNLSN